MLLATRSRPGSLAASAALVASASLALPSGAQAQAQNSYARYHNARYGFGVDYPVNLVQPRPETAHGRAFVSQGGSIVLVVFGSRPGRSLAQEYNIRMGQWRKEGASITYARWRDNWLGISGYIDNEIFYERAVLRNGTFASLIWRYPRSMKQGLDEAVNRSVQTLGWPATAVPAPGTPAPGTPPKTTTPPVRPVPTAAPPAARPVPTTAPPRPRPTPTPAPVPDGY